MKLIKTLFKFLLGKLGYGVFRINQNAKREIYNAYYMGECFKCIKGDPITEEILSGKGWDKQIPEILNSIKSGKIIEIGANIGTSILPHTTNYPELEFNLFEPVPAFYQILHENFKVFNKKSNVKINQMGFAAKEGETIEINIGLGTAGKSKLVQYQMRDSILKIPAKTIDTQFKNEQISFLKIDVDGHELDVLKGGKEVLLKNRPLIFLEYAPKIMNDLSQSPLEITSFLKDVGYKNIKIWDNAGNFIKTTSDWNELIEIGLQTPHYLDILIS